MGERVVWVGSQSTNHQIPRDWPGMDLAERLGVTTRTVRRDIERLRELGYPVHATMGPTGGYRLAAGTTLPPLLLDDDEAVAIAVGLHTAAVSGVTGIDETSLRALMKIERVLPSRLPSPGHGTATRHARGPAQARRSCGGRGRAHGDVGCHSRRGDAPLRLCRPPPDRLPPHSRAASPSHLGVKVVSRRLGRRPGRLAHLPDRPDVVACAERAPVHPPRTTRWGRGRLPSPNDRPRPLAIPLPGASARPGSPDHRTCRRHRHPIDDHTCLLELATDSFDLAALVVGLLDVDFDIESPPEFAEHLRALSNRFAKAAEQE
jgi:biotin operon repressor